MVRGVGGGGGQIEGDGMVKIQRWKGGKREGAEMKRRFGKSCGFR